MGLDQTLSVNAKQEVITWRKAYLIDEWFTKQLGAEIKNCGEYKFKRKIVEQLLEECRIVQADPDRLEEFFGVWSNTGPYTAMEQINTTIEQLEQVLKRWRRAKVFYYWIWY